MSKAKYLPKSLQFPFTLAAIAALGLPNTQINFVLCSVQTKRIDNEN